MLKQKNQNQSKSKNPIFHTYRTYIKQLFTIITLTTTSFALLLSLLTYNASDPSLIFDTTFPQKCHNLLGTLGANLSALALYFFGCSAFLLPVILLYILTLYTTSLFFTKDSSKTISPWRHSIDRLLGLAFLLPLSSLLATIYDFEPITNLYPGGFCGHTLNAALSSFIPATYLPLFLFMLTWVTLILLLRFSFIRYLRPFMYVLSLIPVKPAFNFIKIAAQNVYNTIHASISRLHRPAQNTDAPQTIFKEPQWDAHETETLTPTATTTYDEPTSSSEIVYTHPPAPMPPESMTYEGAYSIPTFALFPQPKEHPTEATTTTDSEQRAATLEHKLERFGIKGKIVSITQGPVVTLFEYQPSIDTKISTIVAREDDLALALQALSLRIIAPIPGRSVIGFEVAHAKRRPVFFYNLLKSSAFSTNTNSLPLILGKDTLGNDVVIDLTAMPHLLVAGSTGSGKSVGLHTMIMSLLCSKTPDEIKFILIDPKRLEFAAYADIAHLLFPIVTEPARASLVLKWAVATMEDRYAAMAQCGVRNAAEYNSRLQPGDENYFPSIIIIIDELADLMMTAGKDVENLIARLAQMARAAGIHLIVATQRPSVDVITGLIKVNFPSRIAYKVTSKVDSRTILDNMGAEKLLGKGDMLFLDAKGMLTRVHGAFVTDTEISLTVAHIKAQRTVTYTELISLKNEGADEDNDELFNDVVEYLKSKEEISISLIQRIFRIGYNRSARIFDQLESSGYILPSDGGKMRKVNKEL